MAHAKEKATNYTPKTVHKTRGAGFASQKVYCFSFLHAILPPEQIGVSQPACLYFMVQFEYTLMKHIGKGAGHAPRSYTSFTSRLRK